MSRRSVLTLFAGSAGVLLSGCGTPGGEPLPQWTGDVGATAPPSTSQSPSLTPRQPLRSPSAEPEPTGIGGEAFLPNRLVMAAVEVDAPVIEVGVQDRVLGVPEDPRELGRWSDGARPFDGTGSIVLTGHVDYRGIPGALKPLVDLAPGDEAFLFGAGGQEVRYVTESVNVYLKQALPFEEIFVFDIAERLVLITCGGEFDRATGHYESNIVAYLPRA